ncbi:unnamed protein product [Dibothriocephalus latus]|uniref:tRNA-dihydrouridine synthase n=1 Tax=Dibothriocephalus latus TaxID=60516 RepID=A0A3P7LRK6_DIBLA|nr:unnamed protein product [Dibothriocephalus latus]
MVRRGVSCSFLLCSIFWLPFRLLVRKHNVDLAYSSMIMSDAFLHSEAVRAVEFTTCPEDRPLIVQLACKNAPDFARCCELLLNQCDGVDLNCGCPQGCDMKDGYGAAILKQPELIADLAADCDKYSTENRADRAPFSVSIKIRLVPISGSRATGADSNNVKLTVELIRRAAAMGVDWVTIHGRMASQGSSLPCQWEAIRDIIDAHIPHLEHGCAPLLIFSNGDVASAADAWKAHQLTACPGVMVARGLLANPALFDPNVVRSEDSELESPHIAGSLLREWLEPTTEHATSTPFKNVRRQAYWMLEQHLNKATRKVLHEIPDVAGLYDFSSLQWPDECTPETLQA